MFEGKTVYATNDKVINAAIREILAKKTGAMAVDHGSGEPEAYHWLKVDHRGCVVGNRGEAPFGDEINLKELCDMPDYVEPPAPKEMTMEQINKELGYKVKVIE